MENEPWSDAPVILQVGFNDPVADLVSGLCIVLLVRKNIADAIQRIKLESAAEQEIGKCITGGAVIADVLEVQHALYVAGIGPVRCTEFMALCVNELNAELQ